MPVKERVLPVRVRIAREMGPELKVEDFDIVAKGSLVVGTSSSSLAIRFVEVLAVFFFGEGAFFSGFEAFFSGIFLA